MNFKILFNIFIDNVEKVMKHTLKFPGDTKLEVTVSMLEGRAAIQKVLGQLRNGSTGTL